MSPRQVAAYLQYAETDKRHDLGLKLNLQALATQGAEKSIKEASDRLLK